jgi:hypothetical protein
MGWQFALHRSHSGDLGALLADAAVALGLPREVWLSVQAWAGEKEAEVLWYLAEMILGPEPEQALDPMVSRGAKMSMSKFLWRLGELQDLQTAWMKEARVNRGRRVP